MYDMDDLIEDVQALIDAGLVEEVYNDGDLEPRYKLTEEGIHYMEIMNGKLN